MNLIKFNWGSIIFLLYSAYISFNVQAHPHSFITLKTLFYVEDNQLTKLHFTWTMDELTSSYLILEYKDENGPETLLNSLMSNITKNYFFSELWLTSDSLRTPITLLSQPENAQLDFVDDKARVSFWVKLREPLQIKNNTFELITYEKTFYVDMYYLQSTDVEVSNNNSNCNIVLSTPQPTESVLNYAQELDFDETPIESDDFILGKIFAQRINILCQ